MESPLEILSLAAHLVDSGMRNLKRARPSSGNYLRQQKRNSAPQLPTTNLQLDEPLDMSLKSRKRAASGDFYPTTTKKYRPSVISFVPNNPKEEQSYPQAEEQKPTLQSRRNSADKNIKLMNKTTGTRNKSNHSKASGTSKVSHVGKNKSLRVNIPIRTTPSLIITPDYTEEGIDEHFRKSLKKYTKAHESNDQENIEKWNAEVSVESHFIRSLGYDQWIAIKQQYKLKKDKETASREQLAVI